MALKPGTPCKLTKGKLIDTHEGFVDTFNWLVDFCSNLDGKGGSGGSDGCAKVEVDRTCSDQPKISVSEIYYV